MNIIETNLQFKNMDIRTKTEKIILHHADSKNCSAEDIHNWHLAKGWAGAGYHFFVRKDGSIYRLRSENVVGAHAFGSNFNSIGICAEGKYMEEQMPDIQKQSLIDLVIYLKEKYNINVVQKHLDVCNTSCPGINYPFVEIVNAKKDNIEQQTTSTQNKNENMGNVAILQTEINKKYGYNIAVDNIYGNETKKALTKALQYELNKQYKKGLAEDGIFGIKTKSACITVKNGAKGNITYLIQAMLICKNFNIKADGIFGNDTLNAVKEFQKRNQLNPDGIVGKETFKKLFS